MPRHNSWILIAALSLIAPACAGSTADGSGGPGVDIFQVTDGSAPAGVDGGASGETRPVMDVGNPQGEDISRPVDKLNGEWDGSIGCPPDTLVQTRDYIQVVHGVRIAYPLTWTASEDRKEGIRFAPRKGPEGVTAAFILSEVPFEEFVAEVKNPDIELEPFPAAGFPWSLIGTKRNGDLRFFEQYVGREAEGGTLIVVLSGRVEGCSPWLTSNAVAEAAPWQRMRLEAAPLERDRTPDALAAAAVQRQRSSLGEHLIESRSREQAPPPNRREIEVMRKSLTPLFMEIE